MFTKKVRKLKNKGKIHQELLKCKYRHIYAEKQRHIHTKKT